MSELTLRQLEYFVAIADTGSITGAAQHCRVTQSAVSLALAQLERSVGATLVIRGRGRGVALTTEGVAVAARARTVMEQVDQVSSVVSQVQGRLSGRLSVGVFRTLAEHTVPALIEWFATRHPDVELRFVEGSGTRVQDELLAGRAHVAFLYRAVLDPACRGETVRDASRMAVFSPDHPLATTATLDFATLARHPAMLIDEEPALQRTLAAFEAAGVTPLVPWRSASVQTIQNVVGRGLAYSVLMQTAERSPEGRPLIFRPLEGDSFVNPVVAALPRGVAPTALIAEAITAVKTHWSALGSGDAHAPAV